MIKETVDAVRLAEIEADKVITSAQESAQDKKNNIKLQAEEYRAKVLKEAEQKAAYEMEKTIDKCNEYNENVHKDVEVKVTELNKAASDKMEEAADAVIRALV